MVANYGIVESIAVMQSLIEKVTIFFFPIAKTKKNWVNRYIFVSYF